MRPDGLEKMSEAKTAIHMHLDDDYVRRRPWLECRSLKRTPT